MILRGVSKSLKFMILDSTKLVKEAFKRTNVDILYSKDLAKVSTISSILANSVKGDNIRTSLSIKGEGAISSIVAKSTINSNVAVKISIDEEKHVELLEAINSDDNEKVKELYGLNNARMQIMVDYGLKTPYTSIFMLSDGLIENAMQEYYEKSEQTKSILICSIKYDENLNIKKSSGLLIQLLPKGDENVFAWIKNKLERLTSISDMLDNNFSLTRIAYLIFEDDEEIFKNEDNYKDLSYIELPMKEDIEILDEKEIKYECDCSRENMERALKISLSKKEIEELLEEDGSIEIECNFCGEKYKFNKIN